MQIYILDTTNFIFRTLEKARLFPGGYEPRTSVTVTDTGYLLSGDLGYLTEEPFYSNCPAQRRFIGVMLTRHNSVNICGIKRDDNDKAVLRAVHQGEEGFYLEKPNTEQFRWERVSHGKVLPDERDFLLKCANKWEADGKIVADQLAAEYTKETLAFYNKQAAIERLAGELGLKF
jgi:hypothetical protein